LFARLPQTFPKRNILVGKLKPDRRWFVADVTLVCHTARLKHPRMMKLNRAMKDQNIKSLFVAGVMLTGVAGGAAENKPVTAHPANAELITQPVAPTTGALETAAPAIAITNQPSAAGTNALPPLHSGVSEFKFNEFFRSPIGPRGLEYTDQLRHLEGRRIRILGYMVQQTKPVAGCFLFTPVPVRLNEHEYGHADDLPATALHVITDESAPAQTPFTPGPLLLTGKLSLGNRTEADGRISTVRLFLDPPTAEQKAAAERAVAAAQEKNAAAPDHHGHDHAH
jgi:hypothetical protein